MLAARRAFPFFRLRAGFSRADRAVRTFRSMSPNLVSGPTRGDSNDPGIDGFRAHQESRGTIALPIGSRCGSHASDHLRCCCGSEIAPIKAFSKRRPMATWPIKPCARDALANHVTSPAAAGLPPALPPSPDTLIADAIRNRPEVRNLRLQLHTSESPSRLYMTISAYAEFQYAIAALR